MAKFSTLSNKDSRSKQPATSMSRAAHQRTKSGVDHSDQGGRDQGMPASEVSASSTPSMWSLQTVKRRAEGSHI
eukprot:CAMPEP_0170629814 /NCGR_PEP_ID=MMETSP0224-20130122/33577_1 /TAXON_ID=285029 /ORGANISM="Togula jolla, Strain CCCM 725" /LENGTH=73 /DNA_ID=CAMNT_0010957649 /DNA_START=391 /DNA_END=609 /DNA_ORIENTATION=+